MRQRLSAVLLSVALAAAAFGSQAKAATAPSAPVSVGVSAADLVAGLGDRVAGASAAAASRMQALPASLAQSAFAQNTGWQCAQFARLFSGIQIFGDAWTWWQNAAGKYARGSTPQAGSVLVFRPAGAMKLGHVAVVSQVLTDRIIQVTHANWSLIGGRRGQVEKDVTVVDVSTAGDWSQVKVWYDPSGDLGRSVYPTYGFVYQAMDTVRGFAKAVGAGD